MRTRWLTIGIILGLVVVNYVDRSAISFAASPLREEFGISAAEYGIISSAFSVGYMLFALLSGPLVDRFGARRVLMGGLLIWAISTALTPFAGGFIGLILLRILLGAGEAPCFPAATRVTSRWLPVQERGKALALIGGVAVSGSLLVGGPILTQIIALTNWRVMFWGLAAVGFLWIVVAWRWLYDSPGDAPFVSKEELEHIRAGQVAEEESGHETATDWGPVLRNRNMWILGFGYFAWGFMFWAFMYWLPQYLEADFGLSIKAVGAFSVAPWAAGVVGALVGGLIVDRVYKRTESIRSRFIIIGVALLLAGAALAPIVMFRGNLTVALICISAGVGCGFITAGIWWVASIDAAPGQPGTAAGFADACFASSGIVAPIVMGFFVSTTGSYNGGFVVMSALCLVGAAAMFFLTKEPQREEITRQRSPLTP
ncbi:MFS transporter [Mycolicibacterium chubuense]|uniref:Putative sulfoacetate transporter SauU n=1 Tax=Mycolicibacterium chubuense TaxID=1800 RepID=A0A0J6WA49_MYCCU|nr:MFS transporter [Mycolicibacterium chubuense]KMO78793.1 putative sulfoacetate transporter SauU [Mycolicibacterium chubuense]ORA53484.1 MFS transporter [Mycolicibacterium chubuense]SPX96313.1 Major facilitator superfamily MFS_1 [Mycolicibacterium chubuense]